MDDMTHRGGEGASGRVGDLLELQFPDGEMERRDWMVAFRYNNRVAVTDFVASGFNPWKMNAACQPSVIT